MSSRFLFPLISVGPGITPADGAKLKFQVANTSDDKDTFEDEGLLTANDNPVEANGLGVFPDIWVPDRERYKVTLFDKNDVQIVVLDPVVTPLGNDDLIQAFDTVADMQAVTSLQAGDVVRFRRYFADRDGGANEGVVVAAGTVDGGAFIDLPNTSPPTRLKTDFPGSIVYVEQYGVRGDDLTAAAANTTALNNANLNTIFKRVHYLGKKYSVEDSISFRSGYQYRGIRDGSEIECLPDKNIMVSEAFVSARGVSPTGELSIHNIRARGALTNLNQIGIAIFDFAIDLQFVEPITCGGGGLHLVDRDDAGTPATGTLVANRVRSCRISNCLGIGLKIGDTDNLNKLTDYFVSNCIISMNAGVAGDLAARHLFTGSAAGSTIEDIFFEGQVTRLVAEILNAGSSRIKNLRFDAVEDRGLVLANIQAGIIATGLDFTANLTAQGPSNRLIDMSQSAAPNTTPSVIIEANVTLGTDLSDIIVVNNQSVDGDIQAKIVVNGGFKDNLILRGGPDDARRDRIQLLADATVLAKLTDNNNDSSQLGIEHNGLRLGYSAMSAGKNGVGPHTAVFPIKLSDRQELILKVRIAANKNDNLALPIPVNFEQDFFLSSKVNAVDNWTLLVLGALGDSTGLTAAPAITVQFVPTSGDEGTVTVVFSFADADSTGIVQLSL